MAGYAGDKDDYLKRLRRIEGQVRGLQRMVEQDTYCIDVLTQVSAVTKALQAVSLGLLEDHVGHCVVDAARESDDGRARQGPRGRRRDRPPRPQLTVTPHLSTDRSTTDDPAAYAVDLHGRRHDLRLLRGPGREAAQRASTACGPPSTCRWRAPTSTTSGRSTPAELEAQAIAAVATTGYRAGPAQPARSDRPVAAQADPAPADSADHAHHHGHAGHDHGSLTEDDTPKLRDLRRRLLVSVPLAVPVVAVSMIGALHFAQWQRVLLVLALPVIGWGAWPFHRAAAINARHGASTMDTLVSLGIIAATAASLWAADRRRPQLPRGRRDRLGLPARRPVRRGPGDPQRGGGAAGPARPRRQGRRRAADRRRRA